MYTKAEQQEIMSRIIHIIWVLDISKWGIALGAAAYLCIEVYFHGQPDTIGTLGLILISAGFGIAERLIREYAYRVKEKFNGQS